MNLRTLLSRFRAAARPSALLARLIHSECGRFRALAALQTALEENEKLRAERDAMLATIERDIAGRDVDTCDPEVEGARHRCAACVYNAKHGAEAEELRGGIERILAAHPVPSGLRAALFQLLDTVDARDALAHLTEQDAAGEPS